MGKLSTGRGIDPSPGELEILHVVYKTDEATAREVYEFFGKEISLSAIQSYMNRLVDKDLLVRRTEGRTFFYKPTEVVGVLFARLLKRLRKALPQTAAEVIGHLAAEKLSDDDIKAIKKLVATGGKGKGKR